MKKLLIILLFFSLPLYASKGGVHGGGRGHTVSSSGPSISTVSLPDATVNVAYSQTLSGTGGTAPYTWTSTTLPTGLTLNSSTGVLSGTPTAIGLYTFVVTLTDAASLTYSQALSLNVAGTSANTVRFSDDFESDAASLVPTWDAATLSKASLNTNPAFSHGGNNSGQYHYTTTVDDNTWTSKVITPGYTHIILEGDLYYKQPAYGGDTSISQRKLFWISDDTNASQGTHTGPDLILNSWSGVNGVLTPNQFWLMTSENASSCTGAFPTFWNTTTPLTWNTWYHIKEEIKLNTSGNSDGFWKVWVDNTVIFDNENINIIGTCGTTMTFFSIGRQLDTNYATPDELRYWDNVVVTSVNP